MCRGRSNALDRAPSHKLMSVTFGVPLPHTTDIYILQCRKRMWALLNLDVCSTRVSYYNIIKTTRQKQLSFLYISVYTITIPFLHKPNQIVSCLHSVVKSIVFHLPSLLSIFLFLHLHQLCNCSCTSHYSIVETRYIQLPISLPTVLYCTIYLCQTIPPPHCSD